MSTPPRPIEIITVLIVSLLGIQITRIYASILSNKIKYKHNSKGITISDLKKELKAITGDLAKGLSIPIFFFALSVLRLISVEVALFSQIIFYYLSFLSMVTWRADIMGRVYLKVLSTAWAL